METTIKIIPPEGYEFDKEKSTLEEIVFKKLEPNLPMSWEELKKIEGYAVCGDSTISKLHTKYGAVNDYRNIFPSKKEAKAMLAMAQLCQLRDAWNEGWKPDFTDDTEKYCIYSHSYKLEKCTFTYSYNPMAFKTKELRNKFMETFKDLLEEAKPFL